MAMRDNNPNLPIKDLGSFATSHVPSDADIKDHRSQETVTFIGLQLPKQHGMRRRHRHHRHKKSNLERIQQEEKTNNAATPPSMRIQFLLGEEEDDEHMSHDLFCEMEELITVDGKEPQWKETARWIKFEEDVEEGGERWSKPHVATLSLHSLFELRCGLMNGTVMLDCEATDIHFVFDMLVDNLIASKQLEESLRDKVLDTLYLRHHHLYQRKHHEDGGSSRFHLPIIRSLAEIGKKFSAPGNLHNDGVNRRHANMRKAQTVVRFEKANSLSSAKTTPNFGRVASTNRLEPSASIAGNSDISADDSEHSSTGKLNLHFMKKIPQGAEAANILVGEVDFLTNHQVVAFIRLLKPLMADLTEVPVPTKFIFVLLGPMGNQSQFHEIGRAIATLFSDEVFRDVAYHAHNREDLLTGIDEFLDQVTVLPPGEWDPSIRIEPPKSVPSQDSRRQPTGGPNLPNGKPVAEDEEDGEPHEDVTLQRTGRFFGGLIDDVNRKAKFYLDDFKDALHIQCVASFFFLYFACLTPIITFGGLLGDATKNNMAAFESLLAGCIVGVVYGLCSGQPLTILGSTGPVLVFETILHQICFDQKWDYLELRLWVGIWTFACLLIIVMFDLSALVRYITRFTEESFALLIALIFIKEAVAKLLSIMHSHPVKFGTEGAPYYECCCFPPPNDTDFSNVSTITNMSTPLVTPSDFPVNATPAEWHLFNCTYCLEMGGIVKFSGCHETADHVPDVFFLSVILFLGTFFIAIKLKALKTSRYFPHPVRTMISDFAVIIAIISMVLFDFFMDINTPKLKVPEDFRPTNPNRGWVINPFGKNPIWTTIGAILPALLATILIFMDQQITAVIVNRKENKLNKGHGYHLDLLIVAFLILLNSFLGLPWFVAATVLSITHVMSLKKESQCTAPGEQPKFLGCREQRVTAVAIFLFIGLSVLMTKVLRIIPMPVLYGVFLYMGVSSLKGMQVCARVMIFFMPAKYQPDYMFLRHVPIGRVHRFTFIQIFCLVLLWTVKTIKVISIVFPLMVLAMCFVRKAMDYYFTQDELKWLDDIMPESHHRSKEDEMKQLKQKEEANKESEIEAAHNFMDNNRSAGVQIPLCGGNFSNIPMETLNEVNISEEMSKTGIWKNLTASESTEKIKFRKTKRRTDKDSPDELPTIPSESEMKSGGHRSSKGKKKAKKTHFYIDEEETDQLLDKDKLDKPVTIVVDPPSDSGSMNNRDDSC